MRGLEKISWGGDNIEHTDVHRDSMTDPAQRAESVKTKAELHISGEIDARKT